MWQPIWRNLCFVKIAHPHINENAHYVCAGGLDEGGKF